MDFRQPSFGLGAGRGADSANAAFEQPLRRRVRRQPCSLERVAALLLAISKNNSHERRDPLAIPDSLTCGFLADLLGVPIATLASLLRTLGERGLVGAGSNSGLRLKDLPGLEKLAACEADPRDRTAHWTSFRSSLCSCVRSVSALL
jgi:hypothetical protein